MVNMKSSFYGRDAPVSPSLPPSMHSSFLSTLDETSPHTEAYHMDPAELQSFAIQVANGMVSFVIFLPFQLNLKKTWNSFQ